MKKSTKFFFLIVSTLTALSVVGQRPAFSQALGNGNAACPPQSNGRPCQAVPGPLLLPGLAVLGAGLLYRQLSQKSNED
jgi:hypothetical protein